MKKYVYALKCIQDTSNLCLTKAKRGTFLNNKGKFVRFGKNTVLFNTWKEARGTNGSYFFEPVKIECTYREIKKAKFRCSFCGDK